MYAMNFNIILQFVANKNNFGGATTSNALIVIAWSCANKITIFFVDMHTYVYVHTYVETYVFIYWLNYEIIISNSICWFIFTTFIK